MLNFVRRAWAPPVSQADLERALWKLGLDGSRDAICHSSLSSFGNVVGGASGIVKALGNAARTVVMPSFTYYTLVWPPAQRSADWPQFLGDAWRPAARARVVWVGLHRCPENARQHARVRYAAGKGHDPQRSGRLYGMPVALRIFRVEGP